MDNESTDKFLTWINSKKFHPSSKYEPGKGHFIDPISIHGNRSLDLFIEFTKIEFHQTDSDDDLWIRFRSFHKILSSDDNCLILASLESIIINTDYRLTLNRVKSSLATLKLIYKSPRKIQPKVPLQITVNPGQSILEILETLLVPNLSFVKSFEFIVSSKSANVYATIWLVAEAIQKSNLVGVSVNLQDPAFPSDLDSRLTNDEITYPPTLALVFDDSDVFSCVDRLLDMFSDLSGVHRKIDIWIQQSVRTKFVHRIECKISKSKKLKNLIKWLQTDAINPFLSPSDDPDECYIKLLTFRKVEELLLILKRYKMIRVVSLWTFNISRAYEITKEITNCQLFTINTIDDYPTSGDHSILSYSKIGYQLLSDPIFKNCVPLLSYEPTIDDFKVSNIPEKGQKNFLALSLDDRFNTIARILSINERITPEAIDLLRQSHLNHSSFKTLNKCLKLRELTPIGIVSVHFDRIDSIPDHSLILGLVGSILLYGNCCLVVAVELPEMIKQFLNQFNMIYPFSIFITSPSTPSVPSIPYGWLVRESDIVGISLGLHQLTNFIDFPDCTTMFGRTRSLYIPIEDQLSLTTPTPSGY